VSFPSNLKNKTLEEIVTGWNEELEAQVAEFQRQAIEIGQWDTKVVQNGERILALSDRVSKLESVQSELEQHLAFVIAQQSELEALLDGIEKELPALSTADGKVSPADDAEREAVYTKTGQVQERLMDLSLQLSSAVDSINRAAATPVDGNAKGSVAEVALILNAHLDALQWIEAQVKDLKASTKDVQNIAQHARLQHERLSA
jgi:nuclear pore complex protein Nup62